MNRHLFPVTCHRAPTVRMVGPGGLEPPTLRLSGVRSNHLSYGPKSVRHEKGRWPLFFQNRVDRKEKQEGFCVRIPSSRASHDASSL